MKWYWLIAFWLIGVLINLTLLGLLVWAIIHFAHKYW